MLDHVRKTHPEIRIIDLRPAILEMKATGALYPRTDVHWSYLAGWAASKTIIDELRAEFPILPPHRPWSDFRMARFDAMGGDLIARLNLRSYVRDEDWSIEHGFPDDVRPIPDSPLMALPVLSPQHPTVILGSARKDLPRVAVFRNSFFNAIVPFFGNYFSETDIFWRPMEERFVVEADPDIVIQLILEMQLYQEQSL